ncbi:hypothetical protein ACQKD8_18205 [Pseudomonas sp. NPDC077405]
MKHPALGVAAATRQIMTTIYILAFVAGAALATALAWQFFSDGLVLLGISAAGVFYYTACLAICVTLLRVVKPLRPKAKYLGAFAFGVAYVFIVGLGDFTRLSSRAEEMLTVAGLALTWLIPSVVTLFFGTMAYLERHQP